ncbi:hypothetical protein PsYK624_136110 [Phanerochaete sordida]|uniref:Uncharacterized protein n=1 Tax=Phanerochaete sordida TaxID=48140 RepID=A0A9P3GNC1_9APHY|nr:hypothetical protein PsYK624_136110 [Phanerochaete sordida]
MLRGGLSCLGTCEQVSRSIRIVYRDVPVHEAAAGCAQHGSVALGQTTGGGLMCTSRRCPTGNRARTRLFSVVRWSAVPPSE